MTQNPAENFVGKTLKDTWIVTERLNIDSTDTTGGFFSVGYKVMHAKTEQEAFLKVVNLPKALQMYETSGISSAQALHNVTDSHLFEVHLAEACKQRKMTRIARAIDHGEAPIELPLLGTIGIPFIVFELGDGDTHQLLATARQLDTIWQMRTLHQAAVGVKQLHSAEIAHQDLKRSNVVFFGEGNAKLIDLGRAVKRDRKSRNDDRSVPCQPQNCPIDLLYNYTPQTWDQRHFAADLYMLGSMAYALFFDVTVTVQLLSSLPNSLKPAGLLPGGFTGPYEDVLPPLKTSLARILADAKPHLPACIQDKFIETIGQLCEPDPAKRGHPRDHASKHSRTYSAERFISAFREMEIRATIALKGE